MVVRSTGERVEEPPVRPPEAQLSASQVLALQRSAGNAAVAAQMTRRSPARIARVLDDDDLAAVADFPLAGELLEIYDEHKKTISYGKTGKGSDIGFEHGAPKITIQEPPQPGILSSCFGWTENEIDAALRQSNIVHELTHAAVVKKNLQGSFAGVDQYASSEAGLKQIMTPSYMGADLEAEIDAGIKAINEALAAEQKIYAALVHPLPGISETVPNAYMYVKQRLLYGETQEWEFPTVLNELYYFFRALGRGFPATKTFKIIKALAERQWHLRMASEESSSERGELLGAL
jgi:hypothetical protein